MSNHSNRCTCITIVEEVNNLTWLVTDPKLRMDGACRTMRARCLSEDRAVFTVDHIFSIFKDLFIEIYDVKSLSLAVIWCKDGSHTRFSCVRQRVRTLTQGIFHIREASVQSLSNGRALVPVSNRLQNTRPHSSRKKVRSLIKSLKMVANQRK